MSAARSCFDPWNRDGTFITINDTVRKRAQQALNRAPEPSISVLDSPSVTTTEAEGAEWLLGAHHQSFPRMQDIRVDEGHTPGFNEGRRQTTTIRLHVIEKPPGQKGCAVIPKRWVGERSMAWAGRNRWERRIIIRRNNRTPESSDALLYPGSIAMILNRLYPRCSFLITL